MPRKPRQTITLTADEVAQLCEIFAEMERAEQGIARLWIHLRGRDAEVARAQAMIRLCLDGTPRSVQYAAILNLGRHCVTQMQDNPDGCPED
jgi:hypothetical protein